MDGAARLERATLETKARCSTTELRSNISSSGEDTGDKFWVETFPLYPFELRAPNLCGKTERDGPDGIRTRNLVINKDVVPTRIRRPPLQMNFSFSSPGRDPFPARVRFN